MTPADVLEGRAQWCVVEGDCREVLLGMPEGCVHSVVTDCPYELGFMSKAWDRTGIAYSVELWREVLRVLKPGGHLLAFGGTRTYHRMTCAIEDAGFEVRDSLHWMYGTGFPKSLNVSKAIDDAAGAQRPVIGKHPKPAGSIGKNGVLGNEGKDTWRDTIGERIPMLTSPATEAAKQWDGWGTALKPGHEPIVLARKPLIGTVAQNVLEWGAGALNIDGCRIGTDENTGRPGTISRGGILNVQPGGCVRQSETHSQGRWPANVLLDEDAARELDEQSPPTMHGRGNKNTSHSKGGTRSVAMSGSTTDRSNGPEYTHDNGGGASRFFYVAKPSRKERDQGCEYLTPKSGGEATDREDGARGTENPRAGAGRTGGAKNFHPTVKPVELMRYLVRLVTPPGGTVLDPFTGSGTTGMAARLEDVRFIGIEKEPAYAEIARLRVGIKPECIVEDRQLALFGGGQ